MVVTTTTATTTALHLSYKWMSIKKRNKMIKFIPKIHSPESYGAQSNQHTRHTKNRIIRPKLKYMLLFFGSTFSYTHAELIY